MPTQSPAVDDVQGWNDAFALQHDIDDYYARSSFLIRWIEQRRLECIRRMVEPASTDRILEVGCGGGHVLRLFPEADLTGIDVSGEMLKKARCNLRGYRVRLLHGDACEADLPQGGFDKAICTEVLEHVLHPEAILEMIRRAVRPGGRVVVTFPNDVLVNQLKTVIRRSGARLLPPLRRVSWGGDDYHLHVWRIPEMRALLSQHLTISRESFVPTRFLPIRCCFQCVRPA